MAFMHTGLNAVFFTSESLIFFSCLRNAGLLFCWQSVDFECSNLPLMFVGVVKK